MKLSFWLNGVYRHDDVEPDTLLLDFLRDKGCYSVKRGCETANCGLCTVLMDGKPVLSCSTLALRAEGKKIVTMEECRKRQRSSVLSLQMKAQNSVASAIRDLS